jgi:hypothetical protein
MALSRTSREARSDPPPQDDGRGRRSCRRLCDHAPLLAALLIASLGAGNAAAQDAADAAPAKSSTPPSNKLTLAYYDFSSGKTGVDVNVRHTFQSSTAWIGGYRESDRFDQVRLGYEYDYHRGWLTLVPSAQAASHGFLGATLYGEAGRRCYGIGGAGRTNLHTYWNLGFDPNDYVQFGAGCRDHAGNTVSVSAIHDNRLDTGQTNTHIVARRYLPGAWRLTFDAVRESGRGDGDEVVRSWALSADVDWRRWFVRVAEDPHVNYTADRQLRVAAGLRF